MDNHREPENIKSYVWFCKILILLLCTLHQAVCTMATQSPLIAKTQKPTEDAQQEARNRLLEFSRQFMSRHVNKNPMLYQKIDFDEYKEYLPRRTKISNYSTLTVFDISEFANESDIPEEITEIYEHRTLMLTSNRAKENKPPEQQHVIVKRLYKALKQHIISELKILNLFTSEDSINNNSKVYAALNDPKNIRNRTLQKLTLEHTSFQTAQWIKVCFLCLNMTSLEIKTDKEEMLNIRDYAEIVHLDHLKIVYSPDPKISWDEIVRIRGVPVSESIGIFDLKSNVPINMPTGMFKVVTDLISIPYVVFKNINFREMEPKNAKRLFIINVPFRDFLNFIKNTSKNTTQAIQLTNLNEIVIHASPINKRFKSNPRQKDVITILQWVTRFNRNIKIVGIPNVYATYKCMADLKANTEKIRSITPVIEELKIGIKNIAFASQRASPASTRPPSNTTLVPP